MAPFPQLLASIPESATLNPNIVLTFYPVPKLSGSDSLIRIFRSLRIRSWNLELLLVKS
jgi:hypothetical protein